MAERTVIHREKPDMQRVYSNIVTGAQTCWGFRLTFGEITQVSETEVVVEDRVVVTLGWSQTGFQPIAARYHDHRGRGGCPVDADHDQLHENGPDDRGEAAGREAKGCVIWQRTGGAQNQALLGLVLGLRSSTR
jgi:hypothetical protein